MKKILYMLILLLSAAGCSEKDASIVVLHVVPTSTTSDSGDKFYFDINAKTLNQSISSVKGLCYDPTNGETIILDEKPGTKTYSKRHVCSTPIILKDSADVNYRFTATDNAGESCTINLSVRVYKGAGHQLLSEKSGITLYSPLSGKNDGFSFVNEQPLKVTDSPEDKVDIRMTSTGWDTMTNIVFTRANNYDYSGATQASLRAVFENSVRTRAVENLKIDDIILVGRDSTDKNNVYHLETLAAIKIMAVYDEEGDINDRLVFNYKLY